MGETRLRIEELGEASCRACRSWLAADGTGGLRLVDPVDQEPIVAHYGDSHLAAALLVRGRSRGSPAMIEQGLRLVRTVLRDWSEAAALADFHHDFNSFALCMIDEGLGAESEDVRREIQRVVLATGDSNHDTVNWLPMRAFVNFCRYEWTGEERYATAARSALRKVVHATNADGGIEDRLPGGLSYNLQYNVASLATLMLLAKRWPQERVVPENGLDFLLSNVLPDGDINYMGRGANQLFAWGPWLYTLASSGRNAALDDALGYIGPRYPFSVEKRNLLLNGFEGRDKSFWWDYHHCSVYHAHFLFWVTLAEAQLQRDEPPVTPPVRAGASMGTTVRGSTGLRITSCEAGGVALFAGRAAYLAEAGPAVCAIWRSEGRALFKGGLGPWKGDFGNKYSFADTVLLNHFGLLSQSTDLPLVHNRVTRRIFPKRVAGRNATIAPHFGNAVFEHGPDWMEISFETDGHAGYLNAPIFGDEAGEVEVEFFVDGRPLRSHLFGNSRSPYGWVSVTRSELSTGRRWSIRLKMSTEAA